MPAPPRADYGLDAPPVVRNLLVAAVAGLGLWASAAAGFWPGAVQPPLGTGGLRLIVAPAGLSIGVTCLAMALWMIWSSRVGKVRAGCWRCGPSARWLARQRRQGWYFLPEHVA